MLNLQYGDLVLHYEVRWSSRIQRLSRFQKLKNTLYNFIQEINELPEEIAYICDNNYLFDFAFLIDVIGHLNDLNLKLQGKEKLFPTSVNDINAFKMKLNLFPFQLENEDLSQFPHLKEQSECADDNANF